MRSIKSDGNEIAVCTPYGDEFFRPADVTSVSFLAQYDFVDTAGNPMPLPCVMYRVDGTTTCLPCNSLEEARGVAQAMRRAAFSADTVDYEFAVLDAGPRMHALTRSN